MLPSSRLVGVVGLGAVLLGLGSWWPILVAVAMGYDLFLVALVVADFLLLRGRTCVLMRVCEKDMSLGMSSVVRIRVENQGKISLWVTVKDEPPISFQVEKKSFRPSDTRRSFDAYLRPREGVDFTYSVTPLERGKHLFGALNARVRSQLGLMVRQERFEAETEVRVIPNIFQTKKYHLLAKQNRLSQMGLRRSRLRGTGLEFESLRDYLPDDELRRVDWKASARRGSLITREYDFERSQNVILLLDLGRTMASRLGETSKLDYAINAALLLAYVAVRTGDQVGILAFADEVMAYLPPGKGRRQPSRIVEMLYPLQPRLGEADYGRAFAFLHQRQKRRALVVLFTDVLDPDSSERLISAVSLLRGRHLVLCVALSDYELADLLEAVPQEAADLYSQTVALTLREDRDKALGMLTSKGVLTIDAAPKDLSVAVVNRYLRIKQEGRI